MISVATSILDIPEEVISKNILPLLSLNDSLRARRSCRRIQEISDDHLRCHPRPRSRNPIRIFVPDQDDSNKNSSLNHTNNNVDNGVHNIKSFLCKEEDLESRMEGIRSYLPIGAPTSHFHIEFESTRAFGNCHLQTFLKLYGDQITQLQVYRQRLPITEKEIEFYENLPNLKCLSVVQKETRNSIGAVCDPKLHLPRVFTKLKELNVDKDCPGFSVWELLDFCTNIRSFSYMNIIEDVKELKRLLSVLDKHQHKRLEFLDLNHVALDQFELSIPERRHLTSLLIALMTKLDLKLLNVAPRIFDVMDQNQRNQFAPRIFSLGSLDITDPLLGKIRSVELFPKVRTAALSMEFNNPDVDKSETCTIIASILSVFSCKNMPSLRILSIRIRDSDFGDDVSLLLPGVWGNFPNLEELYFQRAPLIEDIMFIGKNGELPFLQLTKLKILHLGRVDWWLGVWERMCGNRKITPITDASFVQVFSKMQLREFHFHSRKPLKRVTAEGIRALLNGPFGKSVEVFPFSGWSMEGVSQKEFRFLSKEFPCNKF